MRATCVLTVASLSVSAVAISELLMPRATSPSTWSSRGVKTDRSTRSPPNTGANLATSRRVIDGASSASPVRTSRTAATRCSGVTSLSRNPLAPAASDSYT
jgi:hypothetical protein